jgi:hypothetical protein
MKTLSLRRLLVIAVIIAIHSATPAFADPKPKSKTLKQDEEEKLVVVTGSHIPQRVKRKSIGTNGAQNVRIYTKDELQSTGRFGVGGLGLDPSITFSGR